MTAFRQIFSPAFLWRIKSQTSRKCICVSGCCLRFTTYRTAGSSFDAIRNMNSASEFYHAIQGILKSWTALQLAVSHGFGGVHSAEKAQWMVGAIENYFSENEELEEWELEEFLSRIMSEEFETMLEDGSLSSVSKEIFVVFNLWSQNKLPELRARIQSLPQVNLAECISESNEENSMFTLPEQEEFSSLSISASSGAACSSQDSTSRQKENEDGWTTVVTRSRSKRKS